MRRQQVESSSVRSIGYDIDLRVLEVEFKHKMGGTSVYRYLDVPPTVWVGMMKAKSKGRFVTANIIGRYGFTKPEVLTDRAKFDRWLAGRAAVVDVDSGGADDAWAAWQAALKCEREEQGACG